ncbi:proteasome component C11 [Saitoella complicata NRRL Y-17804]|uniref:Proteasome subunit beta n=1 Tax=Saitoella complicata (strain BCRC 22490 / CBS 7301 / JCM 7358 / NBRC 10748 / NRRL Y-17804) TaxID=698492 RepID=A0A0E9NB54_SAICN|nr:proteasome component C11 [Saitoella complicata NRRL Y-17804]ODQ55234.1 proteasome component C11 [Saitoella complicata NRRL Y-17804]GAO47069.1 hypothetical protein G7K_1281-t1 [Saitoella complicata NRRL Y-17804]
MEVLLALTGKDFVLTASNKAFVRGISVLKTTDDKSRTLSPHNLMLFSGEAGDTVNFAEFIQANMQLYGMQNNCELDPKATASFVRRELADSLRSRKPYQVNLLLAGFDTRTSEPHLYWLDYLAAQATVPYAAHGYGAYYCLSIFDRYHRSDISLEEALDIMGKAVAEVEKRMPMDLKGFLLKVVDKDGVRELEA